jgi:hypothetical protein
MKEQRYLGAVDYPPFEDVSDLKYMRLAPALKNTLPICLIRLKHCGQVQP